MHCSRKIVVYIVDNVIKVLLLKIIGFTWFTGLHWEQCYSSSIVVNYWIYMVYRFTLRTMLLQLSCCQLLGLHGLQVYIVNNVIKVLSIYSLNGLLK